MQADKIEILQGSVVQHGHHNDRIYLMHLHGRDHGNLIATLEKMAIEQGYGKIFAKIPAPCWQAFQSAGYIKEAIVPGFFNGKTEGLFIAKFFSENRKKPSTQIDEHPAENTPVHARNDDSSVVAEYCSPADAERMAEIYLEIFESYAFPIYNPEYIRSTMQKNVAYFCIRVKGEIAALAAAEIDDHGQFCEMTDFATLPAFRKHGFAYKLLGKMTTEVKKCGVRTAYTIARVDSPGINRIFSIGGYRYAGRLAKNTQIGGRIRSMNVWYKRFDSGK